MEIIESAVCIALSIFGSVILPLLLMVFCKCIKTKRLNDLGFIEIKSSMLGSNLVYHKKTKVMYTINNVGTFTVMVDADGNPLLWEEK